MDNEIKERQRGGGIRREKSEWVLLKRERNGIGFSEKGNIFAP